MTVADWLVIAASLGGFVATAVLALLTGIYVRLTHHLLQAQTQPYVVVYARHDESRPSVLQIVIENVGRGVAQDIRFDLDRPIPCRAFGIDLATAKDPEPMTSGPLIEGISGLGPGDSRKMVWGQFGGLYRGLGDQAITVTARFKHRGRELPPVESVLEIRSFKDTDAVDPDGARQSAKELKRIADVMAHSSSGFRPLTVNLGRDLPDAPEE